MKRKFSVTHAGSAPGVINQLDNCTVASVRLRYTSLGSGRMETLRASVGEKPLSPLALGCARLGAFWQQRGIRDGIFAVHAALDEGITAFDTADVYARGLSELILGHALRGKRDATVIVTKCGLLQTPSTLVRAGRAEGLAAMRAGRVYSAQYVLRAAEASLRRLRTDALDVFLLHSPPRHVLENGDYAEAFARLRGAGKVVVAGISVRTTEDAITAIGAPEVGCVEVEINERRPEALSTVVPEASARNVLVFARQPFASGELLPAVRTVESLSQPLRFVLDHPGIACVIAGASRPKHAREIAEAARR